MQLGEAFHQRETGKEEEREVQKAWRDDDANDHSAHKDAQHIEAGKHDNINRGLMFEPCRIERRGENIEREERSDRQAELTKADRKGHDKQAGGGHQALVWREGSRRKGPVAFACMFAVGLDVEQIVDDIDR